MVDCKRYGVMARRTAHAVRIYMTRMPPRTEAVIFSRSFRMACSALCVNIDYSAGPWRRRLSAMAAHRRARTVRIPHGGAAFCIVHAQEHHVRSAVIVIRRAGPRAAVTSIADIRNSG
jgi:hypothetical protein